MKGEGGSRTGKDSPGIFRRGQVSRASQGGSIRFLECHIGSLREGFQKKYLHGILYGRGEGGVPPIHPNN